MVEGGLKVEILNRHILYINAIHIQNGIPVFQLRDLQLKHLKNNKHTPILQQHAKIYITI